MDHSSQRLQCVRHKLRRCDAGVPLGRRVECGLLHAERQEDLLSSKLRKWHAADPSDYVTEQDKVDIAIDKTRARGGNRYVRDSQANTRVVAARVK
jgi:hypothetical protein